MIVTARAANIVSAILLTALALSGCASRETPTQPAPATSTAATVAPATTSATSSAAASATTAKPAGEKVGAAELPTIVSNRTFRGKDDAGEPYSEYYATDGTLRGTSGGEAYAGSWKVVGEQLCFTYPEAGTSETECYAVFKDGDVLTWVTSDGEVVAATYAEGNPDNL
jgi:uncharacterized lipoprotein NlpE involved in copper resistance